ncbi:hypothetical protein [Nannocystis pusilla]|uniref:Uncharacterized protein n=1 Tax=Nannocystis pusilla TaxID=889268 RepID=A0ABS7TKI3_9BACT|nr:hypothetical protein [Nannocystis pusilla]MBZ5708693.1 hypothetical protein [Nannocystis pusilla]
MADYTTSIPVQMIEAVNGAAHELLLGSCTSSATSPVLQPRDKVTAETSGSSVLSTVTAATGAPGITGVTATPLNGSPSVSYTDSSGVWSATFPVSSVGEYSWRVEVTIEDAVRGSLILDPIMIVRKTN